MDLLQQITFFEVAMSLLAVCTLHEMAKIMLPDEIAGPGGWLIDTSEDN
ncbi:hypothetical protein [Parasulfitobacter algicola]|uniref:Uncharacterized protein n=1 Tax=Parasulfitobacter algicola TaxID=2614809 RepID=A0ABX2J0G6_9RHOB|nr:hypothetical protein [Sulfitobacter algicola]NSX56589.1 hypothetical protein [Sulfitobacter algicola]